MTIDHLILRSTRLRELEIHTTTSKLLVHFRVGIESVVNAALLFLIEDNLQDLATIFLCAKTFANNLDRKDEIGQDGIVNGSECP